MRPVAKILTTLARANAGESLSKYELATRTRLAKDTVYYDNLPKMLRQGLVERTKQGKIERYTISSRGLLTALKLNRSLSTDKNVLRRLGSGYADYEKDLPILSPADVEKLVQMIREVHLTGRAAPGWHLLLESWANETGQVSSRLQVEHPRTCATCGIIDVPRKSRRAQPMRRPTRCKLWYVKARDQWLCERCLGLDRSKPNTSTVSV